jgi:deoxyribodipyrimidine photo-lyase
MRTMMWFRSDLRVHDNTALTRACASSDDGVVAVFCVCPRQWREEHDWGGPKAGFVMRQVRALHGRLETLNIPLKIVRTPDFGGVPAALVGLARSAGCDRLFFNREYEWNERRRDEAVVDAFEDAGLEAHGSHDQVLFEPGTILTKSNNSFYGVYSPFKRACWKRYGEEFEAAGGWRVLETPERVKSIKIDADAVPGSVEGFDDAGIDWGLWPAGEGAALERLGAFAQNRIGSYKEARDFPARDETSRVSAYLAAGVLSPRQCMQAALDANGGVIDGGDPGAVGWMEEILWREFYRHVLVGFPRVSRDRNFNAVYDGLSWRDAPADLEAWKAGRTGYPIVDAAMRCLTRTGWMHNRLRMIVAMFLTKHLLIDWREGERHFMRHLVDGDLAANNGGWQWSASTGTDAQPYFRIFNPTSQSEKFDPEGVFIREWVPELSGVTGKAIHEPHRNAAGDLNGYPEPIVGQKEGRERALAAFKAHREG